MGLEIKGDLDFLNKKAKELPIELERKLELFVSDAVTEISARTRRGKNKNETSLGTYSSGYNSYRKSVGRNGGQITLELTGNMLRAMTYTIARRGRSLVALIYFNNTTTTAPKSKLGGGYSYTAREAARATQNRFNWFGLSTKQKRKLKTIFRGKNDRRR